MNDQNDQNQPYQPNNDAASPQTPSESSFAAVDLEKALNETPTSIEPATPFDSPNPLNDVAPSEPVIPAEPLPAPLATTEPSEEPATPLAPAEKGHRGLKATIVVLVILLLGALGAVAYLLFFQPKTTDNVATDTPQTTQNTTNETPAPASAAAIVQKVRDAVTEALKTDYPSAKINDGTSAPAYQPDNATYGVRLSTGGSSLDIDPTPGSYSEDAIKATQQAIADALALETSLKKIDGDWNVRYQSDTVTCSLIKDGSPVGLACADIAAYSDAITKVAPYAAAYAASADGKKYGDGVIIELQKVTEKSDGYKNAWTNMSNINSPVGGFAGLFYYANGQWTYWRGSQSIISCADYNTRDLQKAFEGDSCYDEATQNEQATVKVTL